MHDELTLITTSQPTKAQEPLAPSLVPTHGIVLCAGFGTRLAPITDRLPKPLVPVANRPVLDRVLDRLAEAGIGEVGVNLHHHAAQIGEHIAGRAGQPRVHTVYEPVILETGGGIAGFGTWLDEAGAEHFVVHNADVLTDLDLAELARAHRESGAEATLALVDHGPTNVVACLPDGRIASIRGEVPEGASLCTFSGVAIFARRFLRWLVPGQRASVIDALRAALAADAESVRGWRAPAFAWWRDMGHLGDYLELHRELLVGEGPGGSWAASTQAGVLADLTASVDPGARLSGFVVVGAGCRVPADVSLHDCVVLPGTTLPNGFSARRAVILGECVASP